MTTIRAELAIYGATLNPALVTDQLDIHPSTTWQRGDKKSQRTQATYDYGCWKTSTEENESPLEAHIQHLIDQLHPCKDLIQSFAVQNDCEVEVAAIVKLGEDSPDISLSKEAIAWMCEIGASFDIDVYLYNFDR